MLALLLFIVSAIPIHIAGAAMFFPMVDVMAIYYWSVHKPQAMPDWFMKLVLLLSD